MDPRSAQQLLNEAGILPVQLKGGPCQLHLLSDNQWAEIKASRGKSATLQIAKKVWNIDKLLSEIEVALADLNGTPTVPTRAPAASLQIVPYVPVALNARNLKAADTARKTEIEKAATVSGAAARAKAASAKA